MMLLLTVRPAAAPPGNAPVSVAVGAGPDALVLRIVQDALLSPAAYIVRVDAQQVGGTLAAAAPKSSGTLDTERTFHVEGTSHTGQELAGITLAFGMNGSRGFDSLIG